MVLPLVSTVQSPSPPDSVGFRPLTSSIERSLPSSKVRLMVSISVSASWFWIWKVTWICSDTGTGFRACSNPESPDHGLDRET